MKYIQKVSAIIIKNKKLLLVTAGRDFYWTPGGKIEKGESEKGALKRELKEELGLDLMSSMHYCSYVSDKEEDNRPRAVSCYIVEISGKPKSGNEITDYIWVSKKDLEKNKINLQTGIKNFLIPKLTEDKLI